MQWADSAHAPSLPWVVVLLRFNSLQCNTRNSPGGCGGDTAQNIKIQNTLHKLLLATKKLGGKGRERGGGRGDGENMKNIVKMAPAL